MASCVTLVYCYYEFRLLDEEELVLITLCGAVYQDEGGISAHNIVVNEDERNKQTNKKRSQYFFFTK